MMHRSWRALALLVSVGTVVAMSGIRGGQPAQASTPGPGPALTGADVAVPHSEPGTYDFDAGWRFALVNKDAVTDPTGAYADAARPAYDDSRWRAVHVPHDWSIELNPTADTPATSGTGYYQGGLGWYRKTFTLPASMAGKALSVDFDGVYMDSEIYLNGRLLGRHAYGYTGFRVPLVGAHTDGRTPDVLAVKVRNDVPSSRWYSGSGIYRNVRLVATDPVHVARHGAVVTTPDLASTYAAGYGLARVATTLDATPKAHPVQVVSVVRDSAGLEVGRASSLATTGSAPVTATVDVRVATPRLWSIDAPEQYSVTIELRVGGRLTDTYVSRFGFRWTRFDPDAGFSLNGTTLKLQGVNLHHSLGALGAAVDRDELLRHLTVMKSMGVNAVRTSHNPPAPELVQLCDELGLLLQVEAFDTWNEAKTPNDYARFFAANSQADITEMVQQFRNSPSVVMWSIGNEIPNSWEPEAVPIARRLIAAVRAADPTRVVTIGSDKYRSVPDPGSPLELMLRMLDGVGLNYNDATSIDALHARYPGTFFFESESSSQTSSRGEYAQPGQLNTGENHTPGRRTASSYDNNLESWTMSGEYALKKDRDRPWFLGQFLWSGIDYIGEPTPFDVFPVKTSFFGAVDTALFPKDQYHLFRSQWTDEPMVHVLPMDWTHHVPGQPVDVWAYANVPEVELLLNGRSLGVRSFDQKTTASGQPYLETTEPTGDDQDVTGGAYPGSYTGSDGTAGKLHLAWSVPFEPGDLVAVARRDGREVARDVLQTAGAPAAVRLTPDRTEVAAESSSLVHVVADIVDAAGVLVPDAGNVIDVAVTGGRLVGVDSGRQETQESYRAPHRSAWHGKALVIVAPTGGASLTVRATAYGLAGGSATVAVAPGKGRQGAAPVSWTTPQAPRQAVAPQTPGVGGLTATASFSGSDDTVPAHLVDGLPERMWSNAFSMAGTAVLPGISAARAEDWVAVSSPAVRTVSGLTARFVVDDVHALPASANVQAWVAGAWQPVQGQQVSWGSGSQATRFTFAPVATSRLRLVMHSSAPFTGHGFLGLRELGLS